MCILLCLPLNQSASSYNVNIVVIGCNADMETCEYIISGHTFERRAVIHCVLNVLTRGSFFSSPFFWSGVSSGAEI